MRVRPRIKESSEGKRDGSKRDEQILFHEKTKRLVSLCHRITLIYPVGPEVVGNIQNLYVGEAHRMQGVIRWLNVGAMAPGTTSTINEDRLVSRQGLNSLAQLLNGRITGSGADVLRAGNVGLRVKHVRANLYHQRFFALRGL